MWTKYQKEYFQKEKKRTNSSVLHAVGLIVVGVILKTAYTFKYWSDYFHWKCTIVYMEDPSAVFSAVAQQRIPTRIELWTGLAAGVPANHCAVPHSKLC